MKNNFVVYSPWHPTRGDLQWSENNICVEQEPSKDKTTLFSIFYYFIYLICKLIVPIRWLLPKKQPTLTGTTGTMYPLFVGESIAYFVCPCVAVSATHVTSKHEESVCIYFKCHSALHVEL